MKVRPALVLSLGGSPWEYTLDKRFMEKFLVEVYNKPETRFYVDRGNEIYLTYESICEVMKDCVNKAKELGINILE